MIEEKMKNEEKNLKILYGRFAQIHHLMEKATGENSCWFGEAADAFAVREQELYNEVLLSLNKMAQERAEGEL